jgi:hypothetical protein
MQPVIAGEATMSVDNSSRPPELEKLAGVKTRRL